MVFIHVIVHIVPPECFRLNAQRSNANIAHVANASVDLRSFNHVCMRLRVRAIANVCDSAFA